MKTIIVEEWEEVPDDFTGIVKHLNGNKVWLKEGKVHREDGPAAE
jgi:hypothetical protein